MWMQENGIYATGFLTNFNNVWQGAIDDLVSHICNCLQWLGCGCAENHSNLSGEALKKRFSRIGLSMLHKFAVN